MKQVCLWIVIGVLFLSASALAQPASDYDALVHKGKTQLQAGSADLALASGEAAIKLNADRWEAYALAGGALMNLKRYEEAADKLSEAIKTAPEAKQTALRDLRRQCLAAESGAAPSPKETAPASTTTQAEIVLWKSIENSANIADFQSYLNQYPQGAFVVLAQRHLADAKAQAEIQQRLQQEQLIANLTWTDPATGLMWAKQDNGSLVNWNQANDYCSNLKLAGYSNWRLPTIDELEGIYDKTQSATVSMGKYTLTVHIKGGIRLSGGEWSNSNKKSGEAWTIYFNTGGRESTRLSYNRMALCVRRFGE